MSPNDKPIVFYDGSCPLCRKEIDHYRKLDRTHNVQWCDLNEEVSLLNHYGITHEQAMRRLHGVNPEGRVITGVDTFLMLWAELPYYRYLSKVMKSLGLNKLLNPLYFRFADWRFKKQHCSIVDGKNCAKQD